jgi:hypothetical protein
VRSPAVSLPDRDYLLYEGHVRDALHIGEWTHARSFRHQSPNYIWPEDGTWCVATEIDYDRTIVGGTAAAIHAVVNTPAIEAMRIAPDAPYQDFVNL